ncbi:hypothetical protein BDQ17DRAFT_1339910 [Cyathus striatus]|nr:hypothetical protein BDQ17DRAFT_1339910 [Cyathus striatus]
MSWLIGGSLLFPILQVLFVFDISPLLHIPIIAIPATRMTLESDACRLNHDAEHAAWKSFVANTQRRLNHKHVIPNLNVYNHITWCSECEALSDRLDLHLNQFNVQRQAKGQPELDSQKPAMSMV